MFRAESVAIGGVITIAARRRGNNSKETIWGHVELVEIAISYY